jgi:hypothetical protein
MNLFCDWCRKSVLLSLSAFLAASVVVSVAGCEKNALSSATLYAVKGKVLLADGKPLSSGHVVFVENKTMVTAAATIESDGSFEIKSASGGGLPEGDYKVRIEAGSSTDGKKGSGKTKGGLPFADQFTDEDQSKLTATVTSDETKNNFEFKLIPTKSESGAGTRRGGR